MLDKVYIKDDLGFKWFYVNANYINTIRGNLDFQDFGHNSFFNYITVGEVWINDGLLFSVDLGKELVLRLKLLIVLGLTLEEANSLLLLFDVKVGEIPLGLVNGINTIFVLVNMPVTGTEMVFLNGVLQKSGGGNDYIISGKTINYLTAPVSGDELLVNYLNRRK